MLITGESIMYHRHSQLGGSTRESGVLPSGRSSLTRHPKGTEIAGILTYEHASDNDWHIRGRGPLRDCNLLDFGLSRNLDSDPFCGLARLATYSRVCRDCHPFLRNGARIRLARATGPSDRRDLRYLCRGRIFPVDGGGRGLSISTPLLSFAGTVASEGNRIDAALVRTLALDRCGS